MPTASIGVRTAAVGEVPNGRDDVLLRVESITVTPRARARAEALQDDVGADDLSRAEVERDAGRHVTDRAEPEDEDAPPWRDAGVLHRLPGRRQDVGQVDEPVVRGASGTLIGNVLPNGTRRYSACPPGTWPYSFV